MKQIDTWKSFIKRKLAKNIAKYCTYGESIILMEKNEHLKERLKFCGRGVVINGQVTVVCPENIVIKDNVHIGENSYLDGRGSIEIGENTHISRNFVVHSSSHNYNGTKLPYDDTYVLKPIKIDRNVWVGTHVVLVPGVSIGEGAIIGAGTVVTKEVPEFNILGSQPARTLKLRNIEHYRQTDFLKRYGGVSGRDINL
ncbi:acyltransferase [Romeria aff. gracilis LEGE 07310]|uniref:Acyltransferase n=1 Tax=Vasconcelosia minhoensis LEGE 07310 TaxID=915328 RepID=A0A8J7DQC7_9CYAN|nr:acyltransferase [Romeria gracilis]MBE9076324.1 acyltransferase [Romeria aff. gracilis LEGE 07310]